MNILHFNSEHTWRGGEQQIAYLIEELQGMGVKPQIAGQPDSALEKYCRERDWDFYPIAFKNSIDVSAALKLKELCQKLAIDILHVHSSKSHGIAYIAALIGNRVNIVVTRRVDFPLKKNWLSRHKYDISRVKKIIGVSRKIQEMVSMAIQRPQKCLTIYSGINTKKFNLNTPPNYLHNKFFLSADTLIIGNTSAIAPHKDYYTFVDTAEQLLAATGKNVKFFIIGDGPLYQDIAGYIKSKNLEDKIIMTGFLENINEVLPELDVFLITSETEGLGTSIIDAFASKVPVVATRAGGIPEIVKDRETGLTAPVKSPEALTSQLKTIMEDQNLKEQLVNNAFKLAQTLDKKIMAEQYFAIYKEVNDC